MVTNYITTYVYTAKYNCFAFTYNIIIMYLSVLVLLLHTLLPNYYYYNTYTGASSMVDNSIALYKGKRIIMYTCFCNIIHASCMYRYFNILKLNNGCQYLVNISRHNNIFVAHGWHAWTWKKVIMRIWYRHYIPYHSSHPGQKVYSTFHNLCRLHILGDI